MAGLRLIRLYTHPLIENHIAMQATDARYVAVAGSTAGAAAVLAASFRASLVSSTTMARCICLYTNPHTLLPPATRLYSHTSTFCTHMEHTGPCSHFQQRSIGAAGVAMGYMHCGCGSRTQQNKEMVLPTDLHQRWAAAGLDTGWAQLHDGRVRAQAGATNQWGPQAAEQACLGE